MSSRRWLVALTGLVLTAAGWSGTVYAQDSTWHIIGQVRPRVELRGGYRTLPSYCTDPVLFFTQRSRLGARYSSDWRLSVTVILQDVRTWGDETSTTGDYSADNFDVYRAFADLKPDSQWTIRVGRQGLGYDEDRILGDGDWGQQGRSHDAIRVMWDNGHQVLHGAWAHNEVGDPLHWSAYPHDANYQDLAFVWAQSRGERESLSLLCLYDDHDARGADFLPDWGLPTDRWTIGTRLEGRRGRMHSRVEAYYQTGHRSAYFRHFTIDAYTFALELDRTFGNANAMLCFDYLSGDDNLLDNKSSVFDPPYATTHPFYGWIDYFIDIPKDTHLRGLKDLALKLQLPAFRRTTFDLQSHYFWYTKSFRLGSGMKSAIGSESDLMVTIPIMRWASFQGGYSIFLPTDLGSSTLGTSTASGHWAWMMLDVNVK